MSTPAMYFVILMLSIALLVQPCLAGDLTAQLDTEFTAAYGTDQKDMEQADLSLQPQMEWRFDNGSELVLSGRLRWSEVQDLRGTHSLLNTYAGASRPWQSGAMRAELRDVYLEHALGNGHLRLGKQQIVWGALDGLKLLDAINPQDYREFILDDFDESRISQWSIHLELPIGDGWLELAAVPDTSTHELPGKGATFEFTADRFRFGMDRLDPALLDGGITRRIRRPSNPLRDGTWAARYTRFVHGWDLAASITTGLDHVPVGTLSTTNGGGLLLEQTHRKRSIIGFSAARSFGPLAIRTELAARPGRTFNRVLPDGQGIAMARRTQLSAAFGVDWQAPGDLFVNVQLLHEQIRHHDAGLVQPERDTLATMLVRRGFRYDSIEAELRWYGNLADGDGMVRPAIAWQIGDNTRIRLGADLFYGTSAGLFGQFDGADRLTLVLQKVF